MKRSKFNNNLQYLADELTLLIVTAPRLVKASKVKKAMPKGGDAVVENATESDVQYPCLVRAVYKKNKISTIVQ